MSATFIACAMAVISAQHQIGSRLATTTVLEIHYRTTAGKDFTMRIDRPKYLLDRLLVTGHLPNISIPVIARVRLSFLLADNTVERWDVVDTNSLQSLGGNGLITVSPSFLKRLKEVLEFDAKEPVDLFKGK